MAQTVVNSGDTARVLTCAALVLFMTPGLAFIHAGMVRSRNALVMPGALGRSSSRTTWNR